MTVINGVEVGKITYASNEEKAAIRNNDPIESKLHVIMVVSNACNYVRRYDLAREFITRCEQGEPDCILYIVELAYGDQTFHVTTAHNPRHLQVRGTTPLWHKENLINLGVRKLLPTDWKAVAWIDADIEFDNPSWATDTLKILNGSRDIVQLFSHIVDMDAHRNAMSLFSSFGFQYAKKRPYVKGGLGFWHPGYGWACTRKAYEAMNGLLEEGILGAGDAHMAWCLIGKATAALHPDNSDGYKRAIEAFETRVRGLRLGYTPGVIRHYFHGSKKNRNYGSRWQILARHQFDPYVHLTSDEQGLISPSAACPPELIAEIYQYFCNRNEDQK